MYGGRGDLARQSELRGRCVRPRARLHGTLDLMFGCRRRHGSPLVDPRIRRSQNLHDFSQTGIP